MSNKLRILAASDIHGDSKHAEKLAKQAIKENVDLVILCGDLTHFESSTEGIIGPFTKANKKVLLIPGNHETVATANFLAELYGATNLHGYSIKMKDIGIFGCGGAEIGPHGTSDSEIGNLLKQSHNGIKNLSKKIMVTHVHPSGTKMEKFSDFVPGSDAVKNAIKKFQPNIALCGHVHEAAGLEEKLGSTRIINVGKKGKILEI